MTDICAFWAGFGAGFVACLVLFIWLAITMPD